MFEYLFYLINCRFLPKNSKISKLSKKKSKLSSNNRISCFSVLKRVTKLLNWIFLVNILEVLPESDCFFNGLLIKTVLCEYSVKNYSNIEYFSKNNIRINIRILPTLILTDFFYNDFVKPKSNHYCAWPSLVSRDETCL
jgi:hypothetical protein